MTLPAASGSSCSSLFSPKTTKDLCGSSTVWKANPKSQKLILSNPWRARQVIRIRAEGNDGDGDGDTKVEALSINGKNEGIDDTKSTNPFRGRFLEGFRIFRQNYLIASYQVGAHAKAKMGSILNIMQDAPINRSWAVDVSIGEFGATSEMIKKNVTWVVFRVRIVIDRYPLWGNIIQVDNSITCPPDTNTIRSDCTIRNQKTNQTLVRSTTQFVLMNKTTRRLSKVTQEMRDETKEYNHHIDPIIDEKILRLPPFDVQSAQYVQNGIVPKWEDIDLNGHVNSSGYMDWIYQSTPRSVLESHEIADVIMEFRKECDIGAVVQSLTSILGTNDDNIIQMDHLLLLQSGPKVLRARTIWRPSIIDSAAIFTSA